MRVRDRDSNLLFPVVKPRRTSNNWLFKKSNGLGAHCPMIWLTYCLTLKAWLYIWMVKILLIQLFRTQLFCSSMESFFHNKRVKSNISIMFFSFVTGKVSKHIIFGIDSFSHYIKSSQFLLLNPLFDDFSFSSPGMHILHSQCFFSSKRHEVRWWAVAQ